MNTSKIVGFIQGAFYPLAAALISYVIANLGASGLFNATTTVLITGILSVVEDMIQDRTGSALFGMAAPKINYTHDV